MKSNSQLLSKLLDSISEAVILYDLNNCVEFFNVEAKRIIGDELKAGSNFISVFNPKTTNRLPLNEVEFGEARIENKSSSIYIEFVHQKFELNGNNFKLLKIKDITPRKEIETQLEESEEMLKRIIDNVPHAIFLKDHKRRFVVANKMVALYHDKDVKDILGKSDEDLFTPEEYEPFIKVENEILKYKQPVIIPEETFVDHTGKTRFINSIKMPFYISSLDEWGILGVNLDITEVKKLQEEQTNLMLDHQNTLMQAVVDTQERERKLIAHNLHDGLGQILTAAKMNVNAHRALKDEKKSDFKVLEKAENLLEEAIYEVRNITGDLMPAILKDFGLKTALEKLCSNMSSGNKTRFYFSAHNVMNNIPESVSFNIYRICQEILNNIIKHSEADEATVQLFVRDNELILQAEDDGKGFDLRKMKTKSDGLGLKSIENRVNLIHGTLDLDTSPNMGCSYTIITTI